MIYFSVKPFEALSLEELYHVLKLRTEVFIVEQNCAYQDIDGLDKIAHHILGFKQNHLVAYCRIFDQSKTNTSASIGRVIIKKEERTNAYGKTLMLKAIETIKTIYNTERISISAQQYLIKFYTELGFKITGEGYLEDDIPHIKMYYDNSELL